MGNEGDRQKQRLEQVQAVQMGNLDAEALNFSGISGLDSHQLDKLDHKNKNEFDLLIQLIEVNEFLAKLDAMIAEIQARIDELLVEKQAAELVAQEAFDRMHELEDLLEDIRDDVSPEERKRLIELLGPKAERASAEDLAILIHLQIKQKRQEGLDKTQEVEEIEQRIEEDRNRLNTLDVQRRKYAAASSPEERVSIQQKIDSELIDHRNVQSKAAHEVTDAYDETLTQAADFSITGFSN